MKASIEIVTPEIARAILKGNNKNRVVRVAHVDYLASEMERGRWELTSESIAIADDGSVVDGQHRLLAVIQSNVPISSWVMRGVPMAVQSLIDAGSPRSVADQLHLDGQKNANLTVASLRSIASISCYFQNPKVSCGMARYLASEFGKDVEFSIDSFRQFRPALKAVVIGSVAFALRADRNARSFVESLGNGENLSKGDPAKALRDWLLNGNGSIGASYKRYAVEAILNAAFNAIHGNKIVSCRGGVQGLDYFMGKNRKLVAIIRDELSQQISGSSPKKAAA